MKIMKTEKQKIQERLEKYFQSALNNGCIEIQSAREGDRNTTLNEVCFKIGIIYAGILEENYDIKITKDQILKELHDSANKMSKPLDKKEKDYTISHAFNDGLAHPMDMTNIINGKQKSDTNSISKNIQSILIGGSNFDTQKVVDKFHIRKIEASNNDRFVFKKIPKDQLFEPTNELIIRASKNGFKFSIKTLNLLRVKFCMNPFCFVFPWGSEQFTFNPGNKTTALYFEGRTDFISAVELDLQGDFCLVSVFNKTSKIKISNDNNIVILDKDDKPDHWLKRIEYIPDKIQIFFIHPPDNFKDFRDWFNAGFYFSDFERLIQTSEVYNNSNPSKKSQISQISHNSQESSGYKLNRISDLIKENLPELEFIVNDLIPSGYILIGGKPKSGKSYFALQLAFILSLGGKFLGKFQCKKIGVLFIALEDSKTRLKKRILQLQKIFPNENKEIIDYFFYLTEIDRLDDSGLEKIEKTIQDNQQIKLLIFDTIKRAMPSNKRSFDFDFEYEFGAKLQLLTLKYALAIICIVHTTKAQSLDDVFDEISGTLGTQAPADTIILLKTTKDGRMLYIKGRDIDEQSFKMEFIDGIWKVSEQEEFTSNINEDNIDWKKYFTGTSITINELFDKIMQDHHYSTSQLYRKIEAQIKIGRIKKIKNGYYSLNNHERCDNNEIFEKNENFDNNE